jgi:hypothetical protein|tara:strand:- start:1371 stop:1814 length:444 start_codon:yes stop_codon:yes gene_type:complete
VNLKKIGQKMINLEKIFKNLVLLDFFVFVIMLVSIFFEPDDIAAISDQLSFGFFEAEGREALAIIATLTLFISYFISLLFLYLFINVGKYLYSFYFVFNLLFILISGPVILTSYDSALDSLNLATEGAILILLYCSPIKDKFIRQLK